MTAVVDWCNKNKLTINVSKTKHMVIGQMLTENFPHLQYNDQKIEVVKEYNYLGVELDNVLTLENQINKCVKQANKKMHMIGKLRRSLSCKTTAMLYKQLALPHLEYCDFLIDSALKKHVEKLDSVQKRALRMINYGLPERRTYADIMTSYDFEALKRRRGEHLLMHMFTLRNEHDYINDERPQMRLRNHGCTKFKMKTTKKQRVY